MPRVSKFHTKRLTSSQNPTLICRGMLVGCQLPILLPAFLPLLCCQTRSRKTLVTSGNNFVSRIHVVTGMPEHQLEFMCMAILHQMLSSSPATIHQKLSSAPVRCKILKPTPKIFGVNLHQCTLAYWQSDQVWT